MDKARADQNQDEVGRSIITNLLQYFRNKIIAEWIGSRIVSLAQMLEDW
jgi:hypothetical protein